MGELAGVWAVVVARLGGGPKSRLASVLDAAERQQLALAMLADVLDACATAGLAGSLAVVDTPAAETAARPRGAVVLREPPDGLGGMNAAVAAGIWAATRHGARSVVVLPADVPLVSARDLLALARAAEGAMRAVVVGASRDGLGTNALLLRPPDVIAPSFGQPSVDRHLAAGQAAGAQAVVCQGLDLALDVDTPADVAALRACAPGGQTGRVLGELGPRPLRRNAGSAPRPV